MWQQQNGFSTDEVHGQEVDSMDGPVRGREPAELCDRLLTEVERAVVGKRPVLELVLAGIIADGHILLEDVPGVAKTLIARSFAQVLELDFGRVQFTPDLMPADVTGSTVLAPEAARFEFRPGPVFTNVLLGDEINRAPPKTQAALLEAMAERQVSIDGTSHPLPRPFLVVATQNPVEMEGTYPLPEAQLDRFLLRLPVGYPDRIHEQEVLRSRVDRGGKPVQLRRVTDAVGVRALQQAAEVVYVSDELIAYMVDVVGATRANPVVALGASPRGSLALLVLARAMALIGGRDFATPEDVKAVAVPALAHRLILRPDQWVRGTRPEEVVRRCLDQVPSPVPRLGGASLR